MLSFKPYTEHLLIFVSLCDALFAKGEPLNSEGTWLP